jgi:hypothetical protein
VPDVCTCGAKLPPDARFCHKCGKPQRDEPLLAELEAEARPYQAAVEYTEAPPAHTVVIGPTPSVPRIGFQNSFAVRAALPASLLALVGVVFTSQVAQPLAFLVLALGGFLAVFLYKKRTGQRLSILSGARLGWLCGVFVFVATTVMIALLALALSDPTTVASLRDQMRTRGVPAEMVDQLVQAFHTPGTVFSIISMLFLTLTALPALGGAIGAKLLSRD